MPEPLQIEEKLLDVSFTTKPTYKVVHTYEVTVKIMRTGISLLNTEADIKFLHPSLISTG